MSVFNKKKYAVCLPTNKRVSAWLMLSLHTATCVVSPIAAANAALKSSYRHLTPYVVVAGDTLSGISARYGLSIDELRQLNNASPNPINGERINVGQTIYVPAFSNAQLPELGGKADVSKGQEAPSRVEQLIANQAARLGSSYGSSESTLGTVNNGRIKADSSYGSTRNYQPQRPSFVEQETNYLKQQIKSAFEAEANAHANKLVGGLGNASVKMGFDEKAKLNNYAFDLLTPLIDDPARVVFLQGGIRHDATSNRTTFNMGAGDRHFGDDWMLGYNAFFDHEINRGHSRVGMGGEAWADYLKLSTNLYLPVSNWKDSLDVAHYQEKAARGMDVNAMYYLPQYPQLGLNLKAEQYWGKEVALAGTSNREANPYAATVGLNWSPVPLLRVGVEQRHAKGGRHDSNVNLGLEWKLGSTLEQMLDPHQVEASRKLQGMRHDMVERNNNIVLEYREKEKQVSVEHAAISGLSGEQFTLDPVVTMSHGTVAQWRWSSPEPLLQGAISDTSVRNPVLTLPALPAEETMSQTFTLNLVITDDAGRRYESAPIKVTVRVNPEQVSHRLVILSGAGFADSVDAPNSEAQIDAQGTDIEFVLIRSLQSDPSVSSVVQAEQVVFDPPAGYQVEHMGAEQQTISLTRSSDTQSLWVNKLRVTPQGQVQAAAPQVLSFHAKDAENLSSGKVNITLVSTATQPTGVPSISDLRLSGKLEVGEQLQATYRFVGNGGNTDDQSRYLWGNSGQTAAQVESGPTVQISGEIPPLTLTVADVGEVKELSLQPRNGDGSIGNTITVDSGSLGGAVTQKIRHQVEVRYTSTATLDDNGDDGVRPVARVDKLTAYCKSETEPDFSPCEQRYTYSWFTRDAHGDDQLIVGATAASYTPGPQQQGKQIVVEVTPR